MKSLLIDDVILKLRYFMILLLSRRNSVHEIIDYPILLVQLEIYVAKFYL